MTLDPLAEMELKKLHMGTMSYGADSMDEVAHQLALAFGMTAEQGKRLSPKHIQVQCIESIGYLPSLSFKLIKCVLLSQLQVVKTKGSNSDQARPITNSVCLSCINTAAFLLISHLGD